jgi:hypothetical protein
MPRARPCSRAVGITVGAISRLRWFGATLFGLDDLKRKRGQSAGRAFSPIRFCSARHDCCPTAHLDNDDDVIKTFPSDRADQPLRISVLRRRPVSAVQRPVVISLVSAGVTLLPSQSATTPAICMLFFSSIK